MSAKLIIYITGKPALHGFKRREFLWSPDHGCYLYNGKEVEASEFNAAYDKATKTNSDLKPRVKVVAFSENIPSASQAVLTVSIPHVAVEEAGIKTESELADEAEEVLARIRPERLKKKTGPKGAQPVVMDAP